MSNVEIIMGIVAPLGVDKDMFIRNAESKFKEYNYEVCKISITDELMQLSPENLPVSLRTFLKMQLFNETRKEKGSGFFAVKAIESIRQKRKQRDAQDDKPSANVVYIIDQLKNTSEYNLLSFVYGLNYIQVSLFSNEQQRGNFLKDKLGSDVMEEISSYSESVSVSLCGDEKGNIKQFVDMFRKEIAADASHKLMKKDFLESSQEHKDCKSGQEVAKLFHLSHYYFNLDRGENILRTEVDKFTRLLSGKYDDYPTQDEFGMCLAFQAGFRSNFPGGRQIGASIISQKGEVISVASIRAPSSDSNTTHQAESLIKGGYDKYKKEINQWAALLKKISEIDDDDFDKLVKSIGNEDENIGNIDQRTFLSLKKFIDDALDFHPCTHAEIAAIIDAAKLGVSVRSATLYSTTFPCHLCAKEIINAQIERVVYLEAYPKSKSHKLYPELIDFEPKKRTSSIPFEFFNGVGPKRYHYVYSLRNKPDKDIGRSPLIQYELPEFYEAKERAVMKCVKSQDNCGLCNLVRGTNED